MKKYISTVLAIVTATASVEAGNTTLIDTPVSPPTAHSGSIFDSIHLFGVARLRYEYADFNKPGVKQATLGSLRTRFGIKTDEIAGFKFLAEGENTLVLTSTNNYRAFPGFAPADRAVIADPDNLELNRLQLSYHAEGIDTTLTVGRQYITFADHRFIGDVGWRQNDQTYDAAVLENKSIKDLTITYAFIDQVNRIFGDQTPAKALDYWESESHLIHLEYEGFENHTARAFAYLLEFDNAAANSSDTYGLEIAGNKELNCGKLKYLATAAVQTDGSNNPANYREYFYRAQAGITTDSYNYGIGSEVLTSDGKNSFRFPLGTNHKFNGYADAFLTTPAKGLMDYYAWIGAKALGFNHTLTVHNFSTESGSMELGWEVDYVASRKIGDNAKVILKAAHLDGAGAQIDITRASAEINLSF